MSKNVLEILEMPRWKSRVLRVVAWLIGYRDENVYVMTLNVDLDKLRAEK
jgi:hypothetical protein